MSAAVYIVANLIVGVAVLSGFAVGYLLGFMDGAFMGWLYRRLRTALGR